MNIRKRSKAIVSANTDTCVAHEYDLSTDQINAAVIELSGRYPDTGMVLNTTCTALLHVIRGHGAIMGVDTSTEISVDDQVLIAPNERYALKGDMKVLYTATPAWTPQQAKYV